MTGNFEFREKNNSRWQDVDEIESNRIKGHSKGRRTDGELSISQSMIGAEFLKTYRNDSDNSMCCQRILGSAPITDNSAPG